MTTAFWRRTRTASPDGRVASEHSISVRDVGKTFDNGVEAIANASLEVHAGEFVSIVGESGCGKSTLLRIVAGLSRPSSGMVEVSATPVTGPRRDVGLMFQKPALLEWMTALQNALLPVGVHRRVHADDIDEAMRLLALFGLEGAEFRFPRQLSGGMQQRVALARLLMTGARVRLLDEPFGAVDELTRERLNVELLRIHDRDASSTLLVTHNIVEAVLLSDRVVVMGPRPSGIVGHVAVTLPRPRTPDMVMQANFQHLVAAVRAQLVNDVIGGRG